MNSPPFLFDEKRTAQAAACFLHNASGQLHLIKLIKLMYLAERLSLQRYGEPLTGDKLVSMPHGPVLSKTYDHINGALLSCDGGWETWVSDRANNIVALRDPSMVRSPEQDLLNLSETDLEVINEIWAQFGHWDRWELVKYTHSDACPEWQDPEGSSMPISYETLFEKLGYNPSQVKDLINRIDSASALNAAFSN